MGKAAAFVCVIALSAILVVCADELTSIHGDENESLQTDVVVTSTSTEESVTQRAITRKENGAASNNQSPNRTKKPQPRKGGRGKQKKNNATENTTTEDLPLFVTVKPVEPLGTESEKYTAESNNSVCESPPDIEGAITPRLDGSEHALLTAVTYSCPFGYVSRNSVNHISVCRINKSTGKAEWTVPEITCNPRSCGDPGYLNNGRRIGNLFTFPNKVEYECEEGFNLRGLNSRYCQAGGDWSGRLPTCEQIYCHVPTNPVNGRVKYSSLEYGTELKYECNDGFVLKQHPPRICSEDGRWSNEEPECIEATCEEPQPPKYGTVKLHGDLKVGSLATYTCDEGKRLLGATTTKCLISGKWTFDAPQCVSSCRVPFIDNGVMGRYETRYTRFSSREEFKKVLPGDSVNSDETLILQCKNDYLPVEDSAFLHTNRLEVTCNDGTWSKELQCKQRSCLGEPPPSKNARAVVASRAQGYTIWYICNNINDEKVKGNITCHLGSWIGITPKCLDNPCYTRNLNYPGLVKPAQEYLTSSESFEIECEIGYRKASRLSTIACTGGRWDIPQNPCTVESEEIIISATEPGKTSPVSEFHHKVTTVPPNHQIPDVTRNQECFCTYEYEHRFVKAQTEQKILRPGDSVKKGETVSFECKFNNRILQWHNGFRHHGRANMTCRTCSRWQTEDLPSCPLVGSDTIISYDGDVKVLPGGAVAVQKGERILFGCLSTWSQPLWNTGGTRGASVNTYRVSGHGTVNFVSYLNITKTKDTHSRVYECYMRDANRARVGYTYLDLRVYAAEEGDRNISTDKPGTTSPEPEIQPHVNVEQPNPGTLDVNENKDCFCSYDYEDSFVQAQNGRKTLSPGDRIMRGETISLECKFDGSVLTWQNGLRVSRKAHMTCSTCQRWQSKDLPTCKIYERRDVLISFDDDLKILPGGFIGLEKGERRRFGCTSNWKQPLWNYGLKKDVFVTKTNVSGNGGVYYLSYLDFEKVDSEHNGEYECYVQEYSQRVGSTFLNLRVKEVDIRCPSITRSGIFSLKYSNDRRINSTVTFFCKEHGKRVYGCNFLICLPNGTWSGHYPTCVDYVSCPKFPDSPELQITYSDSLSVGSIAEFKCSSPTENLTGSSISVCKANGLWNSSLPSCEASPDPKCSIHDLSVSVPEDVELDMNGVVDEYVPLGSEVRLKCSGGSIISGVSKAQCGEQGKWKVGSPQCVPGCLLDIDPSTHLVVQPLKNSYRVGEFVLLTCPPGKEMSTKVERLMCLPGRWSDSLPECKELENNGQR